MDRVWVRGRGVLATGGALIAIAAALAGCADIRSTAQDIRSAVHMQPLNVDPSSPVAADVARAERIEGPVPSFATVPPKPTDIRTAAAYKAEVVDVVSDRRALTQWEAANPPGVTDTEGFAEAQRRRLAGQTPVTDAQAADSEAFARRLREAAQEPPHRAPQRPGEAPPEKPKTAPSAY